MRRTDTRVLIAAACALFTGFCLGIREVTAQDSLVKAVFENYKLLGIFAFDCSKPPTSDNYYYVHRLVDAGHVQRDRMSGPTSRDFSNVMDKAVGVGPNEVTVSGTRVEGNRKGDPIEEVWRVEANQIMTVEGTIGGAKVIAGGRFNGQPVPWANMCAAAEAPPPQAGGAAPSPPQQSGAPGGGCHTDSYTFSTVLSQSATSNSVSTGGAACVYTVGPIHPDQVQFTSASIVEQARNGIFEQTGSFAFKYQPNPSFKGVDEYAIKVCGHNNQRAGCATVTYRVTVK